MTNLINIELTTLKAEELRTIAKEYKMTGAWKAKKDEMIAFLENIKAEQIIEQAKKKVEEKVETKKKGGKKRTIEVLKDGELVATIEGLIETFKWADENNVCNQGWVKHSLKTGKETVAGRKYKEGGYLFRYAK